jgi:hypothetical protein
MARIDLSERAKLVKGKAYQFRIISTMNYMMPCSPQWSSGFRAITSRAGPTVSTIWLSYTWTGLESHTSSLQSSRMHAPLLYIKWKWIPRCYLWRQRHTDWHHRFLLTRVHLSIDNIHFLHDWQVRKFAGWHVNTLLDTFLFAGPIILCGRSSVAWRSQGRSCAHTGYIDRCHRHSHLGK